jgi:hypothetical protein
MRPRLAVRHALALPLAFGVAAVLLVGGAETGSASTQAVSASASSRAAAANAALDVASRRDVGARESLRLARAKVGPAQAMAAHQRAALVRTNAALNRARRANPAAAVGYDAATAAVHRAQAAYNAANRAAASSAAKLRSAKAKRHDADVAVTRAAAAVDAAQDVVDDLTTIGPPDSPDLAAANADLSAAKAALARAKSKQTSAHGAYRAASAAARHDRAVRSRATKAVHAAGARRVRLSATEPRGLARARSLAARASVAYRHATSVLQARRLRVQRAAAKARSASAAFRKASAAALHAVRGIAKSDCPTGNVYAGAPKKHVMSAPGLTITRYKKPGRAPMWVTSVNLAGAGPQVRPGPLTPKHVTDRATQGAQLAGSHALAAVNGDFFNIEKDDAPWGAEVKPGGVVVKASAAPESKALVISRTGLAQIGYLAFDITVHHGKATVRANSLNSAELPRNGIAVLTSRWGHASRGYLYPTQGVYEYVVTRRGVVAAVHTHLTATPIPAGGMVIVAQGSARDRLRQAGIRGLARVSVSTGAQSAVPGGLYSAIGVGEVLIRDGIDGNLPCGADTLHARTLVGIKPGGQELFVITAQGQTADKPADLGGLTLRQAQGLMRSLGAYDAAMFDGGGSTLLTARIGKSYKMVSRPTGNVRPIPNNFAFWPR